MALGDFLRRLFARDVLDIWLIVFFAGAAAATGCLFVMLSFMIGYEDSSYPYEGWGALLGLISAIFCGLTVWLFVRAVVARQPKPGEIPSQLP